MLIVFIRTIILYSIIIVILRLLGKRQIGQLQPSELVLALVIADLAASPMENIGVPLLSGIVPILTLFILEEIISYIVLKSEKARAVICGTPSILIEKGVIIESELKRLRYNINDLLEQLRLCNYPTLEEVDFAILETSGQLSIIPKPENMPVTIKDMKVQKQYTGLPITIILDGKINYRNMHIAGLTEEWLKKELKNNNVKSAKEVFFAYTTEDKKLKIQLKRKYLSKKVK